MSMYFDETSFKDLTLVQELSKRNSPFLPDIFTVYNNIKDVLNSRIPAVFSKYTLHNTDHSFRIMEYMAKLIPDQDKLSDLELALLVYSALLHDIGMALSEEQLTGIQSGNLEYKEIKWKAMLTLKQGNEQEALVEYARQIHAHLSAEYIYQMKEEFTVPKLSTVSFKKELALICESHTENYDWIRSHLTINEVRGDYHFNPAFIAAILRLADILDIDSNRTPYRLYQLISPTDISDAEWKQHFIITNNEKILFNENTGLKKIVFHGSADNASIHRKLLKYIGWVEEEISNAIELTSNMAPAYRLLFESKPEINIRTQGYTFSDYKMTLDFKAISHLLMGEKIYGDKSLGLRELIQNSIDACRVRQEKENSHLEYGQDPFIPKIKLILDAEKNLAIIKDNGTGMTLDIIKKNFLNIGLSYYTSIDFLLKDFTYKPIGNFGIGFLSCFMLSSQVKVITRHFQAKKKYIIELEKENEYTSLTETEDYSFEGTEVILNYSQFISAFQNDTSVVLKFLKTFFLTDGIELQLINKTEKSTTFATNLINRKIELEPGHLRLPVESYLKDAEGFMILKQKNYFIKDLSEVSIKGDLYIYDSSDLIKVTDYSTVLMDDYIVDRQLKFIDIPLVPATVEDEYMNGLEFTNNDVEEVIEKLDNSLHWISILVHPTDFEDIDEKDLDESDLIVNNISFEELRPLGHSRDCKTHMFISEVDIFKGDKNNLYMLYSKTEPFNYYWRRPASRKLYLRNVLIKDYNFYLLFQSDIIELEAFEINLGSRKIIPDISRNNIDQNSTEQLNYAFAKTIHKAALNHFKLSPDEKLTLESFINTFYHESTEFEL